MPATTAGPAIQRPRRAASASLYAAGFTTAFGAHSIAANLGGYAKGWHESLLALGVLLALYDGAEVLLKPVFGALADRIGLAAPARPARGYPSGAWWASGACGSCRPGAVR